jgi:uncharacterized protein (DUF58 family)
MKLTRLNFYCLFIWFFIALSDALLRLWDYINATNNSQYDPVMAQDNFLAKVWLVYTLVYIALSIVDWLSLSRLKGISIKRNISKTLPVNSFCDVELEISYQTNKSKELASAIKTPEGKKLNIEVYEHLPAFCESEGLPSKMAINENQQIKLKYQIKALERGDLKIQRSEIWGLSQFGLFNKRVELDCETVSKVYPNFRSIHNYVLLATEQRTRQLGIRRRPKRGDGMDFHQLRDYRSGDSLRQIDWRSTSKLRKVISKEYQQERDQNIIFLIDSGRRMRTKDGDLSHFDQALNASLLVSHIALKQGDAVGLKVFGGKNRFIPPKKGPSTISVLLNQVYDLHPTNRASDIIKAAEELTQSFKKRSLVVIVSNIRVEDQTELTTAVKILKKHHLVLLTNLREQALDDCMNNELFDMRDALKYSQTTDYMQQREKLHQTLTHQGIIAVDSLPSHLAINMANQYFDIKRSGRL